MSGTYSDYRFKFPVAGLATALSAMAQLRSAGLLGSGDLPDNMLGDLRDATGAVVLDATTAVWKGGQGTAGHGDPASYYIHIRSFVTPDKLPFNPATFGMSVTDPAESAAVLGVWA